MYWEDQVLSVQPEGLQEGCTDPCLRQPVVVSALSEPLHSFIHTFVHLPGVCGAEAVPAATTGHQDEKRNHGPWPQRTRGLLTLD